MEVTALSSKKLTSVKIPDTISIDGNTFEVTSIGSNAFNGCKKLTSISIPSSVKTIGNKAFYKCTTLTAIKGCTKVTSIGNKAFYGCTKLTAVGSKSGTVTLAKIKTIIQARGAGSKVKVKK